MASQADGSWGNAIEVPGTAALNTSGAAEFTAVSCASAGNCSADGWYSIGAAQEMFVVGQVNGTWHTATKVRGINSGAEWSAPVSCPSPGNCSAGGYYPDGTVTQPFTVSETSGTWHTAANLPSSPDDEITTISCGSAGNCSAGGNSTSDQAFVVNQTNSTWDTATPVRGLIASESRLMSVSCPAMGTCAAGGDYDTGSPAKPRRS